MRSSAAQAEACPALGHGSGRAGQEWRREIERLAAVRAETLALVEGLTQERADRAAEGRWSAGEILDHLLAAERVNRDQIALLVELDLAGADPYLRRRFADLDLAPPFIPRPLLPLLDLPLSLATLWVPSSLREAVVRSRRLPGRAPRALLPRRGRPIGELRADLAASLAATRRLFEDHPDLDYRRMLMQHPLLGISDALDILRTTAAHEQRHQDQLLEALR
jgi:DinB superfamily